MYYVYRLKFGEREYIGCTNNIRRRKDQHNQNANKGIGKLGRFLKESDIVLGIDDFEILGSYEARKDALGFERKTALMRDSYGVDLLNDNYSSSCTRKGKNIGSTAKAYVVVDYMAHTVESVYDLRQYCIGKGWDYQLVQRTTNAGKYCKYGCKAFHANEWENEPEKEKYISGAFVEETKRNAISLRLTKTAKAYEVQFPDMHTEIVNNLDGFAREHNLTSGTLHATLIRNRPTKGYQVLRRI